jgi:hypothetical protein
MGVHGKFTKTGDYPVPLEKRGGRREESRAKEEIVKMKR